ncbi:putative ADAMTS protein 3 [Daphnia magna]|uniref:Putative ADAMTS protein 3 n=1 Tax=Daphnia magna TaxID=35525 RepID=A0A162NEA3_9CRUS|nr:putative ADAMTS protein 3 [Daphnia magna]
MSSIWVDDSITHRSIDCICFVFKFRPQCSSPCDGGFKVRKVSCQQLLALGQVLTKTANHCNPTSRPAESKPCNTGKQCTRVAEEPEEETKATTVGSAPERPPPASDLPKIQSTNQNFVQQSQSKKKVTLKIGGKATVFKGTQIKIRCPVKHYDKSKINWMKDHILLVKSQKYELNKKGMLRIRDATYSDSGVYSCIAGRSAANITVTVRPAPTASSNLENDWDSSIPGANGNRSKVDGSHVKHSVHPSADSKTDESLRRSSSGGGTSWPASVPAGQRSKEEEEEEEEEDVKEMKGNSLVNKGHKSGFDHGARVAAKPNADETLTSGTTGPLFPDQDQHQPEVGQPSSSAASKNSKNAASRTAAGKNGGHNRSKLRNASAGHHGQQHQKTRANKSASHPVSAGSSASAVILGKGKADTLKFEWLLTPWSKCSQTCGGSGFQVRAVQCIARLNNVTKSVEASLCEDAGLANPDDAGLEVTPALTVRSKQPATVQKCGLDTCPRWVAASWTPCHQSRCFTWNTALQKRQLDCVMDNGTLLDPLLCNDRDKPSQKRECFNENCRGAWKVSDWSHCSATCGSIGHQSRMLRCVWHGTDSPAGLACADLPRLPVTRPCRGPSCPLRKTGQELEVG